MHYNDDNFFVENIVKVNKTIQYILITAIGIPIVFIIGNITKLWDIPYSYCYGMLTYQIFVSVVECVINAIKNKKIQKISMYFGVIAASGFVTYMAYSGLIRLSISYAFATILTCLYYNRPLTVITCIISYVLSLYLAYVQSFTNSRVLNGDFTQLQFIIQNVVGLSVEFIFLIITCIALSTRTKKTMAHLMSTLSERNNAFNQLTEQSKLIKSINAELEHTNAELEHTNAELEHTNAELEHTNAELAFSNQELGDTQYKIIQFVAQVLGSHDLFTGRHVLHTHSYVEILCKQLKKQGDYANELDDKTIQLYKTTAFLHDIGKVHIPEGILNKVGKFTPEEFDMMKSHPLEGKNLLEYLPKINDGKFNETAKDMAYCHHEKWDGSGYPRGLKGKDIPLCARIMAAADVLDALISQRLYKAPMSIEDAIDVFKNSKGTHFEPCIVDAVIACEPLIELIDQNFKNSEAETNTQELEW